MKDLIIIIALIIIVSIGSYYTQKYVKDTGQEIVKEIEVLEEEIKQKEMNNNSKLAEIKTKWQEVQDKWNMIADHKNTDEIQKEIEKLIINYEQKDVRESLINITTIKTMIEDTPKEEKLTWVNIL